MTNTDIEIKSKDGGTFNAYLSLPQTQKLTPAVVVIQEIFGVNKNMRAICDIISSHMGFIAICPDLFWRQEPGVQITDQSEAEWKKAFSLYQGFDVDKGIEDLSATVDFIRADKSCSGKVATLGYCLGGKLAYLMAARSSTDCNVSYYGVGIEALLDEAKGIKNPLLMHIAENDKFVPPAAQKKIMSALTPNKNVRIEVYPGMDHAFTRKGGEHYDETAAKIANERTAGFLTAHLA